MIDNQISRCFYLAISFTFSKILVLSLGLEHLLLQKVYIKSNLALYSRYYAEACKEFAGRLSTSLRQRATQILLEKCRSGGEPLVTLYPI